MSDISIDLSGVIALLVFLLSAASFGICGLIAAILAYVRGSRNKNRVLRQPAFTFFAVAAALGLANLIAFGILLLFVDSMDKSFNAVVDKIVLYVWLPLELFIWIGAANFFNKLRRKNV